MNLKDMTLHDQPFGWRAILYALLALTATGILAYMLGGVLELIILSALLAYLLDPITTYLESKGLTRMVATLVVLLGIVLLLVLLVLVLYPVVVSEIRSMQSAAVEQRTTEIVANLQSTVREKFAFLGLDQLNIPQKMGEFKKKMSEKLLEFLVTGFASLIVELAIIPFVVFFLLKDGREMKKLFISKVPNPYFEFSLNLIFRMDRHLGNYLRGQSLDAAGFGILVTLVLWILGVKYAVFLGVFAGLANLIPYVGPLAGGLLSATVALLDGGDLSKVGVVAVAFVGIKLADDAIIQPLTVAKSVEMHPLAVLIVVILGGKTFGILGMLLSVPAVGFVMIFIEEIMIVVRKYRRAHQ